MPIYYCTEVECREIHSILDSPNVSITISEDSVAEMVLSTEVEPPLSYADATPYLPRPDEKWASLLGQIEDKMGKDYNINTILEELAKKLR